MTTQQPTSDQVMQWCNNAAKLKTGEFTETLDLASFASLARADHEATIKEQAAEIERLKSQVDFWIKEQNEQVATANAEIDASNAIRQQLAAAQLHIEKLREALLFYSNLNHIEYLYGKRDWDADRSRLEGRGFRREGEDYNGDETFVEYGQIAEQALSTQPDLSALEAERQKAAESANAARIQAQQELADCRDACVRAEHESQRARGNLEAERQRVAEACARYVRSNGIGFADDDEELNRISANLEAGQWKDHMK